VLHPGRVEGGSPAYERELLSAFIRTNHATWTIPNLRHLFRKADPARLRAAGDPLPGSGPFTVYRGVAGRGRDRLVRGLSWTGSIEVADAFARDHARRIAQWCAFPDPGVYRMTIGINAVLAYTNKEEEQEFVVMLPATARPERMR
jgi:hypothetical protein